MNAVKSRLAGLAILGGRILMLYGFALSESAKQSLKQAASTIREVYGKMAELADEIQGQVVEDGYMPNRERTIEQWKNIGY